MRILSILLLAALTTNAEPPALGIEFVKVEPGKYRRGFADGDSKHEFALAHLYSLDQSTNLEKPSHGVEITKPFAIAKTEVTVGQFKAFVAATGYLTTAEKSDGALGWFPEEKEFVDRFHPDPAVTWKSPGFKQTDAHPVVAVSWQDAQAFCAWRTKTTGRTHRLPTEAEWEYACRAGTDTWYSWGRNPDDAYTHANVADGALESAHPNTARFQRAVKLGPDDGDGTVFTAPVASFKANRWGLHDMHGNVWEWCQDRWKADLYKSLYGGKSQWELRDLVVTDPFFEEKTSQHDYGDWRVLRGGAWTCAPAAVRSSIRTFAEASDASVYTGFRIVRE